jgi:protein phosphatase 1G
MEDAHIAVGLGDGHLFGVFDGHGGAEVARFCSKYMSKEIVNLEAFQKGQFEDSLRETFHRMDELLLTPDGFGELDTLRAGHNNRDNKSDSDNAYELLKAIVRQQRAAEATEGKSNGAGAAAVSQEADERRTMCATIQAGCTACVALIKGEKVYIANAGDSRAVLCRGGKAVALSNDHKPTHTVERTRIIAAGGQLTDVGGITRVNGNLNLSRAIGDLRYKMNVQLEKKEQIITAEPDIQTTDLTDEDTFLIIACDGIWDVMSNQQVVDYVSAGLNAGKHPTIVASNLLDDCVARDPRETKGLGCDNMSLICVVFSPPPAAGEYAGSGI